MRPLRRAHRLNVAPKLVFGKPKITCQQHGATMTDPKPASHKRKKRKRHDPPSDTTTPAPAATTTALVTAEKAKKPKKMGGKSPSQVCKEINELKLGNALVKLKSDGDVLPWIRSVFLDEEAKGYSRNDMKIPKSNFQRVRYKRKPKVEQGKSTRLAMLQQTPSTAALKRSPSDCSVECMEVDGRNTEHTIEIKKGVQIDSAFSRRCLPSSHQSTSRHCVTRYTIYSIR